MEWTISRHADVCAALEDARLVVPPAPPGPPGTIAWLRGSVSRFANGAVHAERRAVVEREIGRLDAGALRAAARVEAAGIGGDRRTAGIEGGPLGTKVGSTWVVVGVLWDALVGGPRESAVEDVLAIAAAYFPGADAERIARADAAVARLAGRLGDDAARIGVLVQACDATAGLIANALPRAGGPWPAEAVVAETLRFDPPVPRMRRQLAEPVAEHSAGTPVVLDIAAANRDPAVFGDPDRFDPGRAEIPHLTFGHGLRPCPGTEEAVQIAAGAISAAPTAR